MVVNIVAWKTKYQLWIIVAFLLTLTSCGSTNTQHSSTNYKQDARAVIKAEAQNNADEASEQNQTDLLVSTSSTLKNLSTVQKKYKPSKPFLLLKDADNSHVMHRQEGEKSTLLKGKKNIWQKIVADFQFCDQYQDDSIVAHYIHKTLAVPNTFSIVTLNASPYIAFVYKQIKKRNMPAELALLPIVESGYKATAKSHRGAAGLWQFTRGTGKHYGLTQNWWYDARLDVRQSTIAALNYLQDLNYKYKSWPTTLAAYNYGTGNINRLIKRNKRKKLPTDYWSLNLPKETRQYVPKLLAYCHLLQNTKKYRLKTSKSIPKSPLISVNMSQAASIEALAKATEMPLEKFKKLNPGFLRWAPKPQEKYAILIPQSQHQIFQKNISGFINDETIAWGTHQVKSGDTISGIAKIYGIRLKALIGANQFRKNGIIRPGDKLAIPIQAVYKRPLESSPPKGTHLVKAGDTLYDLARQYKIKIKNLIRSNKLNKNAIIRPGDLLKIPKRILNK